MVILNNPSSRKANPDCVIKYATEAKYRQVVKDDVDVAIRAANLGELSSVFQQPHLRAFVNAICKDAQSQNLQVPSHKRRPLIYPSIQDRAFRQRLSPLPDYPLTRTTHPPSAVAGW